MIELKNNSKSFSLTKPTKPRSPKKKKSSTVSSEKETQGVFVPYTQSFTFVRPNGEKINIPSKSEKTKAPAESSNAENKVLLPNSQSFSLAGSSRIETVIESDSQVIVSDNGEIILPSAESFTLTRSVTTEKVIEKAKEAISKHAAATKSIFSFAALRPGQVFFLPNTDSFSLTGPDLSGLFLPNIYSFTNSGINPEEATAVQGEPLYVTSAPKEPKDPTVVDERRRMFLKAAAGAGLGLAGTLLLPKKAEAYILGSSPTTGVVGVKDSTNTRINPATEETLDEVLKTSDLSFNSGALEVSVTSLPASSTGFSDATDTAKSALVDADRHVQVDVVSSALPTSASTESTLQTISFGGHKLTIHYDETGGTYDYVGEAAIGTATSAASWRIKRIDNSSGVTIEYAGTGVFDQIWDDRTTLTYS